MERVSIDLAHHRYPILIGTELLQQPALFDEQVSGRVLIVTDERVAPLYLQACLDSLASHAPTEVVLPVGEAYKSLDTMDTIFTALLDRGYDRACTLVALGGGVIGDMTGFAAASFQRGVNFIQVPTTLLAQVDSSVGGKTGVNHRLGKNMIGAFHQPSLVLADMSTLGSLPDAELRAGLAEVIKYGFILDAEFFSWLERNLDALLAREPNALAHAVRRSCEIKAEVVMADEREHGQRALLNLGHTFGHAIEAEMGYGQWLHGEAISAGMVMALDLSKRLGWVDDATCKRGQNLLERAGLPLAPPGTMSPDRFLAWMRRDKKVSDGRIRLILLEGIGRARVTAEVSEALLHETLKAFHAA